MLDRTIAPPFVVPAHAELKKVESHILGNGIPLHELILGDQEVCRLEMIVRSGKWHEPKAGVSYFTSKMLLEGTPRHSSKEISEKLDYYGAFYEVSPGLDFVAVSFYCLSKYVEEVIPYFIDVIADASFPEKELETQKKIKIQQIRVNNQKTSALAASGFRKLLFGERHPYGHDLSEAEVGDVNAEDLKSFHRQLLFNKPEFIVSGKISPGQVKSLAAIFENFPQVAVDTPVYRANETPFVREIIPLEDSMQSSLRIGTITANKYHPDHFKIMLLNELFGGYFGSRLMKNIREDKGYTYGIHSSISFMQQAAFWTIGTDVKREVAISAIEEIGKEMKALKQEPVPAGELETVKNYMTGTFLTSIASPFSLVDKFKSIHFSGLGYEYYDQFLAGIRDATAEDLMRVANDFLKEEEWIQVVAGGI